MLDGVVQLAFTYSSRSFSCYLEKTLKISHLNKLLQPLYPIQMAFTHLLNPASILKEFLRGLLKPHSSHSFFQHASVSNFSQNMWLFLEKRKERTILSVLLDPEAHEQHFQKTPFSNLERAEFMEGSFSVCKKRMITCVFLSVILWHGCFVASEVKQNSRPVNMISGPNVCG